MASKKPTTPTCPSRLHPQCTRRSPAKRSGDKPRVCEPRSYERASHLELHALLYVCSHNSKDEESELHVVAHKPKRHCTKMDGSLTNLGGYVTLQRWPSEAHGKEERKKRKGNGARETFC